MATVATVCEECEAKRFEASVLEYRFGGRDISEVLAMSVTDAAEFFERREVLYTGCRHHPRSAVRRRARRRPASASR